MKHSLCLCVSLIVAGLLLSACGAHDEMGFFKTDKDRFLSADKLTYASNAAGPSVPNGPEQAAVTGATFDTMYFRNYGTNPFIDADEDALSTFAIDVDTGSYTITRSYLNHGALPPMEAVRVEEFVNYFDYGYASSGGEADAVTILTEAAPSAFRENKALLRVALQARGLSKAERKPAILTFVIDTSGSMGREDRLGLIKETLRMLVYQMTEDDEIGIAVYGNRGREWLSHRGIDDQRTILAKIDAIKAEGSTNAEEGLKVGYAMAKRAYQPGAVNRVILCSDGVANVGATGPDEILEHIRGHASKGITLTTIGVGMGNYNDVLMEQLADDGNGSYHYVDSLKESRRVFIERLPATLETVARDTKVQVEFNPDVVRNYRLIGYENRAVADQDFRTDSDGGEMGAGQAVTALYEVRLWPGKPGNIATVNVRYKDEAQGGRTVERTQDIQASQVKRDFEAASDSFQLAACVAQFSEILRGSYWVRDTDLKPVQKRIERLHAANNSQETEELIAPIRTARTLNADNRTLSDP